MPSVAQILEFLSLLSTTQIIVGLICTASVIALIKDWRLSLSALFIQYALVGLLLSRAIYPPVAWLKVLVGGVACLILYLTARHVRWGSDYLPPDRVKGRAKRADEPPSPLFIWEIFPMSFPFRLFAVVLAALGTYGLLRSYPLAEVSTEVNITCYWLAIMGLLTLMLAKGPFKGGLGLLTFESGFETLYTTLEGGLSVTGLLGIVNILIALAIAYLTVVQVAPLIERERET